MRVSRNKQLCSFTLRSQVMVNGPQGFAMTKAGMLKISKVDTVRSFFGYQKMLIFFQPDILWN
jgi:hypothetical protein